MLGKYLVLKSAVVPLNSSHAILYSIYFKSKQIVFGILTLVPLLFFNNPMYIVMSVKKYIDHRVALTDDQLEKLILAAKGHKRMRVTIRLLPADAASNAAGTHVVTLPLTQSQLSQFHKPNSDNLTLSAAQMNHLVKSGGFLPLLALLPLLFGGIAAAGGLSGGIAGLVSAASNSKAAAAAQTEAERHNREIEAQLKSGSGTRACKSGSGVISDKIQNIPLLGALAPYLRKIGLGAGQCRDLVNNKLVHTKHGLEAKLGYGIFLGPRGDGIFLGPQGKGIFLEPQGLGFGETSLKKFHLGKATDSFLGPKR